MKIRIKLQVLMLVIVLIVSAAGCGRRPGLDEDGDGAKGGNEEIREDIAVGVTVSENGKEVYMGSKEGKTCLKIAYTLAGYGGEFIRVIASHFVKEHPDVWVYLLGDPGLTEAVSVQLQSGKNVADIYMPLAHNWNAYVVNGWLEELSDVFDARPDGENGKTVYEKMIPIWQSYCRFSVNGQEGKYIYPWSSMVTGIAYNGRMFRDHNWKVPETWNELLELCGQIKKDTNGKVAPFVYPGLIGGYWDFIPMSLWMQTSGVEGLKEFFAFGSPEVFNYSKQPYSGMLNGLEEFTRLFGPGTDNVLKGSMSKNHTEAQRSFLRNEAAMIVNANWLETEMKKDIPEGFEMRMMRMPYTEKAVKDNNGRYKKVNYGATCDFMLTPNSAKHIDLAKKFLVHMAKDEMLVYFTKYTGGTMRPFKYDISSISDGMTPFANDCMEIFMTSESYFDFKTGPYAHSNDFRKYITCVPFTKLIYGPDDDGFTPLKFAKMEYLEAKGNWDKWVEDALA